MLRNVLISITQPLNFFQAATLIPNEDAWEDLSDDTENDIEMKTKKSHNKRKKQYSSQIKNRINALRVLQLKQKIIESKVSYGIFLYS